MINIPPVAITKTLGLFLGSVLAYVSCDKNNNLSFFSVENDLKLGQKVDQQIKNDSQFPILDSSQHPQAYSYLDSMTRAILASDAVAYGEEFAWEFKIIDDSESLNAFATPGGYIYVYSGLIKFLPEPDALAGVLAHEIAHADLRHTSRNLQRQYGVSILLAILLGQDPGQLQQIAGQVAGTLSGLSFSRKFERESDSKSVEYLADTEYGCQGAKIFFQKLEESGQGGETPQFLSTHPSPDNRVTNIEEKAAKLGCATNLQKPTRYQRFQNSLP